MKNISPNHRYELRVSQGIIDDEERVDDGVKLLKEGEIQFEKNLHSPSKGAVASDGTSVIVQGKNWDKPEEEWEGEDQFDTFYIYNNTGELLIKKNLGTSSGIFGLAIDGNGTRVALSGPDEGNVILFDAETGEKINSKNYDEIGLAFEITAVRSDDEWIFELVDTSEQTELFIDTDGEVIPESEVTLDKPDENGGRGVEEPIEEILRQRGIPVPDTVFGLPFRLSGVNSFESVNNQQLETIIRQGPVYEPKWSEYKFAIPDPPKVLYVLGSESISEAAEAFSTFCDVEQIDLSKWYQVTHISGTMTPNSGDFETALRQVSRQDNEDSGLVVEGDTLSFDTEAFLDNFVQEAFFGKESPSDSSKSPEVSASRFPDNEFGETLRRVVSEDSTPYTSYGVTSGSGYRRLVEDSSVQQVINGFPELLDLLESGTIFQPYSVDSQSSAPSVQPVFDAIAKESPETVFKYLNQLEEHLLEPQSMTAAEVSYRMLQTVVEEHPNRFDELVPLLDTLLENRSVHPQRRALDIIETGLRNGAQNSVSELKIAADSIVNYLLDRMEMTESAWLLAASCSVIQAYELDSVDYDQLEEHAELLIRALQFGEERRGELISSGLGGPLTDASTDEELREEIRSPVASSKALYMLSKYGAGPVLRDLASERPETILKHLEALMKDLTATGEHMQEVRKVARRILQTTVENLPEEQYEILSQYDSEVLPLLQTDDRHNVDFALEWARKSGSEEAIDALANIHEDNSDDHWQQATAILGEIAPNRVNPEIEPDNIHTEWLDFVGKLAEERGQLPAGMDVTEHPDSPETPYWEVFAGWSDVLESLGIDTNRRTSNAPLRRCLLTDFQQVADQVDGKPTTADIEANSEYSYYDFKTEFGGIKNAREAANLR
jgi:hypothetical protein